MTIVSEGPPEGERRKRRAFDMFATYRRAVLRRARRVMIDHVLAHGTVTIDDVRAVVDLPPNMDPRVFGAVPGELARGRIVRRIGYRQTGRPVGHARPVTQWALIDADAAAQWKRENPDLPDPAPPAGPYDYQI